MICDELEVDFKPRIKFMADLGGYVEKEDSDANDGARGHQRKERTRMTNGLQ